MGKQKMVEQGTDKDDKDNQNMKRWRSITVNLHCGDGNWLADWSTDDIYRPGGQYLESGLKLCAMGYLLFVLISICKYPLYS